MNVYVICSNENKHLAKNLLRNIVGIRIITSESMIGEPINNVDIMKKGISSSDAIVALIDDDCNAYLKNELELALSLTKKQGKIFLPIQLNDSTIIDEIKHVQHLTLDTSSATDLHRLQTQLEYILVARDKKKKSAISKTYMITLTIAIEVMCMFLIVMFYGNSKQLGDSSFEIVLSIMSVFLAVITLAISYISVLRRRHQEDAEEEIEFYSRRLKSAIVSVSEKEENKKQENGTKESKQNIDALGRMLINLEDIKEFYTWSQKQAKASFILAVAMCVFGFLLMCAAVVLPIAFKLQLQVAIIPAVGGVITELVAGTALIVYKSSLKQLNHYHKALHEDERFLSSVNLIGKFSSVEVQDEMLKEIIRSEIQMNLFSLKNDDENRIDKSK